MAPSRIPGWTGSDHPWRLGGGWWRARLVLSAEHQLTRAWPQYLLPAHRTLPLGSGVRFEAGDWVVARPNVNDLVQLNAPAGLPRFGAPRRLWFGEVEKLWQHDRAHGLQAVGMLEVKWHKSREGGEGVYDLQHFMPVMNRQPDAAAPFILACGVLPLQMMMVVHP